MPLGADGFCLPPPILPPPKQAFATTDPLPAAQWAPWKITNAASSSCSYRGGSSYFTVEMPTLNHNFQELEAGVSLSSNLGSIFCSPDQVKEYQDLIHTTENHLSWTHAEVQVPTK